MPDFTVKKTVHMGMVVGDLDWTVTFFQNMFGFELLDRSARDVRNQSYVTGVSGAQVTIAYMQSNGLLLEIAQYSNPPGLNHFRPEMAEVGHFHICLLVDDIDAAVKSCSQYDARIEFLSSAPLEVDNGPNKGNKIIVMRMPDGVMLEFISTPGSEMP